MYYYKSVYAAGHRWNFAESAHSATRNRGNSRSAPVISKKDAPQNPLVRIQKHAIPFPSTQCQISILMPHHPIQNNLFQGRRYPIMTSMTADPLPRRQILSSVPPLLLPQHPVQQPLFLRRSPSPYLSIPLPKGRRNYSRGYQRSNASSARAYPQRQGQRCSCTSTRTT
jgi:hypothetical protein